MTNFDITIKIPQGFINKFTNVLKKYEVFLLSLVLSALSIYIFIYYYYNGLGLAYNDARSHLDIARRVVEGLKPGLAQLGSVWLPLPHLLMTFTIWNDFMWHSGLAGAIISMISYVVSCIVILKFLKHIKRTKMIAHLVSFENENMMKTYKEIRKELENYDKKSGLEDGLSSKKEIIILTKTDVVEDQKQINKILKEFEKLDKKVFVLSLFNDESVKGFRDALVKILKK